MRFVIVFLFFILLYNFSFSQGFSGGISAGIVASQVDGDRLSGYDKVGLLGGVFVIAKFSDKIGIKMDIRYLGKGAKKQANPEIGDLTYFDLRLHYIEIPVLFQYTWKKFTPEMGLGYNYLVKSIEDSDGSGGIDPIPAFNNFEFSGYLGLSYKLSKKIKVNTQYSYSILAVRKHPGNQSYYLNKGQYNNVINLNIQYSF